MSDLGLQYVSGINLPNQNQAGYVVQVSDDGLNLVYRFGFEAAADSARAVELLPIGLETDLAVPISDPQTTQITIDITANAVTELAYELTARDTSNNLYDRRGGMLVYRDSGNVVDSSGLLDTYAAISNITGASADLSATGTTVIVRTTGGTASSTTWDLRIWRAVTEY